MRIAFCGAAGTGKTTLASYLVELLGLPMNPVGSRSVAAAMGFASPYDVDKAGKRLEFQSHLLEEKLAWERTHDAFVTDRTTLDNLVYTLFHADARVITKEIFDRTLEGLRRYTHVVYCPVHVFCNPAGDPSRVHDLTYHTLFDAAVEGLLFRTMERAGPYRQGRRLFDTKIDTFERVTMLEADLDWRKAQLRQLGPQEDPFV